MGFDTWNAIIDPTLRQSLDVVLHYLDVAASKSDNPGYFLDKLTVEWMTMAKSPDPPEHEYLIVRTKDMENDKVHMFVLDRMTGKVDHSSEQPRTKDFNAQAGPYHQLASMEEGRLASPSTLHPSVALLTDPQQSKGDILSLSAAKASQVLSHSLDKDIKIHAFDRILGQDYIYTTGYGKGQNAGGISFDGLTFFELILLAQTVHEFAPHYSPLDKNCFWFCSMVFNACMVIYSQRSDNHYSFEQHSSEISGRWNGLKVHQINKQELSAILYGFKRAYSEAINEVKTVF
jgi:hypothetical protein